MMRTNVLRTWSVGVLAVAIAACGGGGDSNPTGPTGGSGGTGAAVTINIVATGAAQSFSPNPANMGQTPTVSFRNSDGTVHRIVANDGSFDTGNINPGASSQSITVAAAGSNYHCTIHPAMIGAIGAAQGEPPPPCTGEYC
jgi:plastocyanin